MLENNKYFDVQIVKTDIVLSVRAQKLISIQVIM